MAPSIATHALLPGIGGTFTRFGHVEVPYVTEFLGLLLTFAGYRANVRPFPSAVRKIEETEAACLLDFCLRC